MTPNTSTHISAPSVSSPLPLVRFRTTLSNTESNRRHSSIQVIAVCPIDPNLGSKPIFNSVHVDSTSRSCFLQVIFIELEAATQDTSHLTNISTPSFAKAELLVEFITNLAGNDRQRYRRIFCLADFNGILYEVPSIASLMHMRVDAKKLYHPALFSWTCEMMFDIFPISVEDVHIVLVGRSICESPIVPGPFRGAHRSLCFRSPRLSSGSPVASFSKLVHHTTPFDRPNVISVDKAQSSKVNEMRSKVPVPVPQPVFRILVSLGMKEHRRQ